MIKCENLKVEVSGDMHKTIGPELVTLIGYIYDVAEEHVGKEEARQFVDRCYHCAMDPPEDTNLAAAILCKMGITEPEDMTKFFGFCQE